ncbi:MAG: dihydroorotate dehydrogenase [Endomicrobiia bacterium]
MNNIKTKVGRLVLKNPVLIASGVCGFGEENVDVLNKVGGVVFKTVTLHPREGNSPPRVVDTCGGMLNSIGLENPGVDGLKEKLSCIKRVKTKKIASFLGFDEDEFVTILKKVESYKIFDAYEINLSCPNVKKGDWFYNLTNLKQLLKNLRAMTTKPLIAKLSPETEIIKITKICAEIGYDGVTLTNTYSGVAVDYKKQKFCLGNIVGGLSGPAIKPLVLRWIYEIKKSVTIDIIGCGGIVDGKDAIEHFLVGASAIQVGCGYFRNPQLPVEIVNFIEKYLREKKISLKNLVGKLLLPSV